MSRGDSAPSKASRWRWASRGSGLDRDTSLLADL
jgi:hypothetical protein